MIISLAYSHTRVQACACLKKCFIRWIVCCACARIRVRAIASSLALYLCWCPRPQSAPASRSSPQSSRQVPQWHLHPEHDDNIGSDLRTTLDKWNFTVCKHVDQRWYTEETAESRYEIRVESYRSYKDPLLLCVRMEYSCFDVTHILEQEIIHPDLQEHEK